MPDEYPPSRDQMNAMLKLQQLERELFKSQPDLETFFYNLSFEQRLERFDIFRPDLKAEYWGVEQARIAVEVFLP